jgi:hypothetical protein
MMATAKATETATDPNVIALMREVATLRLAVGQVGLALKQTVGFDPRKGLSAYGHFAELGELTTNAEELGREGAFMERRPAERLPERRAK